MNKQDNIHIYIVLMNKQVVLVSTGTFQTYILDNIEQLLQLGYIVHIILDKDFFDFIECNEHVILVDSSSLDTDFDKKSRLDKKFRHGFWHNASKRLFLLYAYMRERDIENVIHIENDVLLYTKMEYDLDDKIYVTMDAKNRCIPGIMYIPRHKLLKPLIDNYDFKRNDMVNMSNFFYNHTDFVEPFPIIDNSVEHCTYNKNYETFRSIFDGAAMGQYLGGVDPMNEKGDTTGFVNETCHVKYNKYEFSWIKNGEHFLPYIIIGDNKILINNLHIHSKNLKKFRNNSPIENKYIKIVRL